MFMRKSIHILGGGILCECIVDLILNEKLYSNIFIYDDNINKTFIEIGGVTLPICGGIDLAKEKILESGEDYFIALGINNRNLSQNIIKDLLSNSIIPVNIISEKSVISEFVTLGINCIVFPGSYIGCNVKIGDFFICYSNCSIEHHLTIGNLVVVCPMVGIASNVTIGNYCFIGIGTTISNNITIGDNCIIGASSLILKSIEDDCLAYGVPAKSFKKKKEIIL